MGWNVQTVTYDNEGQREIGITEHLADGWEWVIPNDDKPLEVQYRRFERPDFISA